MSEPNRDPFIEMEKARLDEELRHSISRQLLRHCSALFGDAMQKQRLSLSEAEEKGLAFVDIYTQETAISTPLEKAVSLLLTPTGDWLRPNVLTSSMHVYYPAVEMTSEAAIPQLESHQDLMWIEWTASNGESVLYTVTNGGVQETVGDLDTPASLEAAPWLSHEDAKALLDELRTYRLAPMDHYPLFAEG